MLADNSRTARTVLAFALLCGLATTSACGDDEPATERDQDSANTDEHDGHVASDAGHTDHDAEHDSSGHDEPEPCTDAYPDFREGLSASAGGVTVRLLTIAPEPARQMMDNDWTLEVVDQAGAPIADATIEKADSWMPIHQHGGRKTPTVEALEQPGRFKLDNIDFRMPGPWQVRVDVKTSSAAEAQQVALQLCVK